MLTNLVLQVCSQPPLLDLDMGSPGTSYQTSYVTRGTPQTIAPSGKVTITDADDTEMTFAWITLMNPLDGSNEGLEMTLPAETLASMGITVTFAANRHSLTLQGSASLAAYQQAIAAIAYYHMGDTPDLSDRFIDATVNDGGANSNTATTTISLIAGSLPVEWLFFEGHSEGQDALLHWATASELNSDYFEVERSLDGRMFTALDRVAAAGTTEGVSEYRFRDKGVSGQTPGSVYYRLRQVDLDGVFDYSNTIELLPGAAETALSVKVFPNPVRGAATLQLESRGLSQVGIRILSLSGQVMWEQSLNAPGISERVPLDLSGWSAGYYFVQARGGAEQATFKIEKR